MDSYVSRFILESDEKLDEILMKLPGLWWSRPYEYAWAARFVKQNDIVLDAACGVCHPFKFYMVDRCQAVYACDTDPRILSKEAILADIVENFYLEAFRFPPSLLDRVNFSIEDITQTSYHGEMFDKIFCISVLEHLKEKDVIKALREFNRILKNDGRLVLTIDVPYFDIKKLPEIVKQTGWEFVDQINLEIPKNPLRTELFKEFDNGLYSFRALLQKQ